MTPGGNTWPMSLARSKAESGVFSEDLRTRVLPVTSEASQHRYPTFVRPKVPTASNSRSQLPGQHEQREVPGDDGSADAVGLVAGVVEEVRLVHHDLSVDLVGC